MFGSGGRRLARVAVISMTTKTLVAVCASSGGGESPSWLSLEGAMRRFAPPEAMEALDQISRTAKVLVEERPVRRAPEVLDLLLVRALDGNETSEERLDVDSCVDVDDPRFVRFAWRHASSSYGFVQLKALGMLPGVGPSTVGDVSIPKLDALCVSSRCGPSTVVCDARFKAQPLYGGVAAPAFYVCYCPKRKSVVVAIRGTADLGDVLTDLARDGATQKGLTFEGALSLSTLDVSGGHTLIWVEPK